MQNYISCFICENPKFLLTIQNYLSIFKKVTGRGKKTNLKYLFFLSRKPEITYLY